jgi:hypothetical protein
MVVKFVFDHIHIALENFFGIKSRAVILLCALKICQLFGWPGLKGRIRIRNDLKSGIQIKSYRIHNTEDGTYRIKLKSSDLEQEIVSEV